MPTEALFAAFVTAMMEALGRGMEGAQTVCKRTVTRLCGELEAVKKLVEAYVRRRFSNLILYSAKLRELLLKFLNGGLKDGMMALATQGGVLFRENPNDAPRPGTVVPMNMKTCTRLREMAEGGAATSLVERKKSWKLLSDKAAGSVSGERKAAPGKGGGSVRPPREVG